MSAKANKKGLLSGLNERERKLVMAMAGVFLIIAIIIPITLFQRSMEKIDSETEKYQESIDLIALAGPDFLARKASASTVNSHKTINDDILADNTIKLTSFVAEHAAATEITVASYDEDAMPFGSKKGDEGPVIIEKQLRVEIRDAEMNKLIELLDRIEKSTDPVWIKRLDVRKKRKSEGQVRAVLTVSTFVKKIREG